MYCKNCGNKLDGNSKFCSNCGVKIDIVNNLENNKISSEINNNDNSELIKNNNSIEKRKKTINIICKILLIFSFLFIVADLFEGELFILFPSLMLIVTTIGILKTKQKKNNIFLVLGIIAISLTIFMPIVVMFGSVFVIAFIKLFGGFKDVSILDGIIITPQLILNMKGGIVPIIILIIIGIAFIVIHKKQKVVL